jgi:hypothetical protein
MDDFIHQDNYSVTAEKYFPNRRKPRNVYCEEMHTQGTHPSLHKREEELLSFLANFLKYWCQIWLPNQLHWDEPFLRSQKYFIHTECFQRFMEPGSSFPYSQERATGHYPQPHQSSPYILHALISNSCYISCHLILLYLIALIIFSGEFMHYSPTFYYFISLIPNFILNIVLSDTFSDLESSASSLCVDSTFQSPI